RMPRRRVVRARVTPAKGWGSALSLARVGARSWTATVGMATSPPTVSRPVSPSRRVRRPWFR
ncbi:MAG: hypothetical protein ACRCZD_08515, partial [Phycicoccus sp.]